MEVRCNSCRLMMAADARMLIRTGKQRSRCLVWLTTFLKSSWDRVYGFDSQARRQIAVEQLSIDTNIAIEELVVNILKALDKEFLQEEFDEIDEVVIVFWNFRRETGQTMEYYIMAMQTAKTKMEKEDPDTKIGEKAYAVRLLKRAGLSREEKQQVLSDTGAQYERATIERALHRLFKDVSNTGHRAGGRHFGTGRPQGGVKSYGGGRKPFRPQRSHKVYNADVESEFDDDESAGVLVDDEEYTSEEDDREAYYGEPSEAEVSEEEEQYYDALATFNSARKKLDFAKKKLERGYNVEGTGASRGRTGSKGDSRGRGRSGSSGSHYASKSIDEKKAGSTCSDCSGQGHWHGDACCHKVKSGKNSVVQEEAHRSEYG